MKSPDKNGLSQLLYLVVLLVSILSAGEVSATGTVSGKILQIRVDFNGLAMIIFDKDIGNTPPSCVHQVYKNVLAVDARTDGGKAVLSMALAAKAIGATVLAHGLGACSVYGPSIAEDWNHGFLQ